MRLNRYTARFLCMYVVLNIHLAVRSLTTSTLIRCTTYDYDPLYFFFVSWILLRSYPSTYFYENDGLTELFMPYKVAYILCVHMNCNCCKYVLYIRARTDDMFVKKGSFLKPDNFHSKNASWKLHQKKLVATLIRGRLKFNFSYTYFTPLIWTEIRSWTTPFFLSYGK